jgi:hypothetical protein
MTKAEIIARTLRAMNLKDAPDTNRLLSLSYPLRNFPAMPRSRSNEKEFSHWNPYRECFATVRWCPTGSDVRTRGATMARKIHATLRSPDVPMDGKLSLDSGQWNCCHRMFTATSRYPAYWQSLRAKGDMKEANANARAAGLTARSIREHFLPQGSHQIRCAFEQYGTVLLDLFT